MKPRPAILAIALAAVLTAGCSSPTPPSWELDAIPTTAPSGVVYSPADDAVAAPAFVGTTLEGASVNGTDFLHGRVAVVWFMSSWCDGCAAFADTVRDLAASYGDAVAVVSVDADPEESAETAKEFATAHQLPGVVVRDLHSETSRNYAVTEPGPVGVIDSAGQLVKMWVYGRDEAALKATLASLIVNGAEGSSPSASAS